MNIIFENLKENHVIYEPNYAGADRFINADTEVNQRYLSDIEFIRINLLYTDAWKLETDIFEFFKEESLEKLRHGRCVLILDITLEGWSPKNSKITISLHQSCIKNGVDPRKVFYLTSNHKEASCYSVFLYSNYSHYVDSLNICENIMISELSRFPAPPITMEEQKTYCQRFHNEKLFLQLSRRNRVLRVLANHQLYINNLINHASVSQDKLTDYEIHALNHEYHKSPYASIKYSFEELKKWNDTQLPYVVDYPDFDTNWAAENMTLKYHETLFSVVLETSMEDNGGTAMFISEKTFKAMMNRHPLIIFGQKGVNHFLRDLGFLTYENYFNIESFDFENDHYLRYETMLKQIKNICNTLKTQSLKERIKWRFQHESILEHNYSKLFHSVHSNNVALKLHETIKSYFDNNFHGKFNQNPYLN